MHRVLVVLTSLAASTPAIADNWPNWRGPDLNGVSPSKSAPLEWSESSNVLWKVPLPSWAGSTPIVWGDRVFLLSPSKKSDGEPAVGRRLRQGGGQAHPGGPDVLLLCLSTQDGRTLWQRKLDDENLLWGKQNSASPSPVTDGKLVFCLTGNGRLSAWTLDGDARWSVDLQKEYGAFRLHWGYASSPLLFDDLLIVQVLHGMHGGDASYLAAFSAADGRPRWKVARPTDAPMESPDAYTTPTLCRAAGRTDLVISGGDYVSGHDPASGRERWRCFGLNPGGEGNYRVCGSPLVVGDLIIAPSRVRPVIAVKAGGAGDVSKTHVAWRLERGGPDVPTPVSDGRNVYFVNDRGQATCVDARSGSVVWGPERTAVGTVSASPVLADGKLYITNEAAVTTVLAAGDTFKLLATNKLDESYTLSSPVIVGGRIYLRTGSNLYCIGEK